MSSIIDRDVVTPTLPGLLSEDLPRAVLVARSAFNYDMDMASLESGLECKDVSRAVQSSRDEVDINTIVRRFGLTGQLPHDLAVPQFADFDVVHDFHSAMNLIGEARDAFMAMPADVRARFGNDPQGLVAFVSDPANVEEARKLGIAAAARGEDPLLEAVRGLRPAELFTHAHDPAKPV